MKNKRTPDIRFAGFIEDWEQRKLGELIEISSAARVHKNEWTTSGVRFFRSSDVVSNFNGKKNTPAFISYNLYDELSKKSGIVQPGDILVTGGGSIGIPYLIADQEPLYFKDADLIWLSAASPNVAIHLELAKYFDGREGNKEPTWKMTTRNSRVPCRLFTLKKEKSSVHTPGQETVQMTPTYANLTGFSLIYQPLFSVYGEIRDEGEMPNLFPGDEKAWVLSSKSGMETKNLYD